MNPIRFTEIVYIAAPYSVALTAQGFVVVDEEGHPAHDEVFHGRPDARAKCIDMNDRVKRERVAWRRQHGLEPLHGRDEC